MSNKTRILKSENIPFCGFVFFSLVLLGFIQEGKSFTMTWSPSPDTMYLVEVVTNSGRRIEYQCEGYKERNKPERMELYFNRENLIDRTILNMDNYNSVSVQMVPKSRQVSLRESFKENSRIPEAGGSSFFSPEQETKLENVKLYRENILSNNIPQKARVQQQEPQNSHIEVRNVDKSKDELLDFLLKQYIQTNGKEKIEQLLNAKIVSKDEKHGGDYNDIEIPEISDIEEESSSVNTVSTTQTSRQLENLRSQQQNSEILNSEKFYQFDALNVEQGKSKKIDLVADSF